jgi:sugar lactone lactonase YvrE
MTWPWSLRAARAFVLVLVPSLLGAQSPSHPAVDSANVARAAWGRMNAARRANDLATARAEALRAATAWPTQSAYQWARAALAARAGDTAGALAGLRAYAALGIGRDLASDSVISALRGAPGFDSVRAAHDRNRAPLARGTVLRQTRDSTLWPEGVDHDPRTGDFYVASVRRRTIVRVAPDGSTYELWPAGTAGLGAMLGVRVDAARGKLWATTSGLKQAEGYVAADSAIAALLRIDARTGRIERRWDLPVVPGGHVLGDVALGPRGDVYVTDSNEPVLYRLRPGADTLDRFGHPLFRGLQGVAATPDGRFVYVADYAHGLLRLRLSDASVVRLADAPGSTSLGCDGIVLHRGAIVAVQNGVAPARIVRFALSAAGDSITAARVLDQQPALAPEPTIGTMLGDRFVYVANSQWEVRDDEGRPRPGATLTGARLIAVPLGDGTR